MVVVVVNKIFHSCHLFRPEQQHFFTFDHQSMSFVSLQKALIFTTIHSPPYELVRQSMVGNISYVTKFLSDIDSNKSLNAWKKRNHTYLAVETAAFHNQCELLHAILPKSTKDEMWHSACQAAIEGGHVELAMWLGHQFFPYNKQYLSMFTYWKNGAAKYGHELMYKCLSCLQPKEMSDNYDELQTALENHQISMAQMILRQRQVNINYSEWQLILASKDPTLIRLGKRLVRNPNSIFIKFQVMCICGQLSQIKLLLNQLKMSSIMVIFIRTNINLACKNKHFHVAIFLYEHYHHEIESNFDMNISFWRMAGKYGNVSFFRKIEQLSSVYQRFYNTTAQSVCEKGHIELMLYIQDYVTDWSHCLEICLFHIRTITHKNILQYEDLTSPYLRLIELCCRKQNIQTLKCHHFVCPFIYCNLRNRGIQIIGKQRNAMFNRIRTWKQSIILEILMNHSIRLSKAAVCQFIIPCVAYGC